MCFILEGKSNNRYLGVKMLGFFATRDYRNIERIGTSQNFKTILTHLLRQTRNIERATTKTTPTATIVVMARISSPSCPLDNTLMIPTLLIFRVPFTLFVSRTFHTKGSRS